jgi:hypothetical protein
MLQKDSKLKIEVTSERATYADLVILDIEKPHTVSSEKISYINATGLHL